MNFDQILVWGEKNTKYGKKKKIGAGDLGSIPGSRRSPGGGHGNPLQYSCLENLPTEGPDGHSPWGLKELDMTE